MIQEGYAEAIAGDAVRIERLLPGPVERVWAWLAEPERRRLWLAGGEMDPFVGGVIELHFRHAELSDDRELVPEHYRQMHEHGHVNRGRITVYQPPRLLAYTWGHGPDDASEVRFELTPQGDRVRLVLVHQRLQRGDMAVVAGGWHAHLAILGDRLRGLDPEPFWTLHAAVDAEYRRRLPA